MIGGAPLPCSRRPASSSRPPSSVAWGAARRTRASPTTWTTSIRGLVGSALAASPVNMAVAALGGYGRRALSPYSDVDLLLVFAGDIGTAEEAFLKGVLHPLWDLGLTVGHQVRTLEEALTIEVDNPTFLLSQADARLLAGSPALFAYVDRRGPSLTGKAREQVIEALLRLTTGRYDTFNDTIYQLEPDIKEAPGGLRDIVAARLLASLATRSGGDRRGRPRTGRELPPARARHPAPGGAAQLQHPQPRTAGARRRAPALPRAPIRASASKR